MPRQKEFTYTDFDVALNKVRSEHGEPRSVQPDLCGASPNDFNVCPTPEELNEIYTRGFRGIQPETVTPEDRASFDKFMAAQPSLYELFPWARDIGKGKVNIPYLAITKFDSNFGGDEAQTVGSCTVHGSTNAAALDYASDCLWGETTYKGRLVKENTYRSRGYNGHGWSCAAPCRYVGPDGKGGMLYRKVYEGPNGEKVDLTKLNESWASNGRSGVPTWLEEESRKSKVKWVIPINNMNEYRDAIAMGFGINVCSGQGYSSTTDENGVAAARGSWSHAMAHLGVVDTPWAHNKYGDMIGAIQQSWGRWNTQKGKPDGVSAQPVGMFWSRASTVASMIRGRDSFAMCGVWGWERTGWEAFNVTDFMDHMRNSTTQDYYKYRQEQSQVHSEMTMDGEEFSVV